MPAENGQFAEAGLIEAEKFRDAMTLRFEQGPGDDLMP
jgi:hypothetical protein